MTTIFTNTNQANLLLCLCQLLYSSLIIIIIIIIIIMSTTSSSRPPNTREETIYVLFGSQTGNSEQAAHEFCAQAPQRLASKTTAGVTIRTVCLPLDDFLELHHAAWTRLTVIFTSSYGVGQAPLGCYRFRELCDAWLDQTNESEKKETEARANILQGFSYALCGLGDSKYTTYFQNPTRLDQALTAVGATRVGPLGQCDASGTGDNEQPLVIRRWMDDIWPYLVHVIAQPPLSDERLVAARQATVDLCRQINPDFVLPSSNINHKNNNLVWIVLAVLVAIAVALLLQSQPTL